MLRSLSYGQMFSCKERGQELLARSLNINIEGNKIPSSLTGYGLIALKAPMSFTEVVIRMLYS